MFKIGEFSRIAQTAITQLRYYDQIGLFQPEHIDQYTGYRYYRASQLPDLNRILALRELGLTLDQIKRLVEENVSAEEIRGMLSLKKAQVEQELHAQVDRLHHIEARLRQVDQEGGLSQDDIVIRQLPAQPIYSFRHTYPDIRGAIEHRIEMNRMLPRRIPEKNLGHFVAIMHQDEYDIEDVDIEIGYLLNDAVDEPFELSSGHQLATRMLPRVETAACVVRVGGMENSYDCYGTIGRWLEANNYQVAGPVREVFLVQPPPDRIDELVCEIQYPITLDRSVSLPLPT